MDTGMHLRMRTVRLLGRALGAAALALVLAACGHRPPASSSAGLAALQPVLDRGGFKTAAKRESVLLLTPGADGSFSAARIDMKQVEDDGVPERVRLHPNDVLYVPRTWIADMNVVVDQYIRGLIPTLPRVGAGVQVN